jgi:CubicO group peptidase (beta-lactamase class C family)
VSVEGTSQDRFSQVRAEFERNFAERGEVGASVCVTVDGETVVDLWGGAADPDTGGGEKRPATRARRSGEHRLHLAPKPVGRRAGVDLNVVP